MQLAVSVFSLSDEQDRKYVIEGSEDGGFLKSNTLSN